MPGKGLTLSLTISTKRRLNKKQKASISINEITPQDFSKLLNKFINLNHLCYKKKIQN